jgi:hypothetical protein
MCWKFRNAARSPEEARALRSAMGSERRPDGAIDTVNDEGDLLMSPPLTALIGGGILTAITLLSYGP